MKKRAKTYYITIYVIDDTKENRKKKKPVEQIKERVSDNDQRLKIEEKMSEDNVSKGSYQPESSGDDLERAVDQ